MTTTTAASSSKALHIALWVVQGILVVVFLVAGGLKLGLSGEQLVAIGMGVGERAPWPMIKFIGLCEVLGAVGLVLPAALRIVPWLSAVAAGALALLVVLGAGEHAMAGEYAAVPVSLTIGLVAAFVAVGRFKLAPIAPR